MPRGLNRVELIGHLGKEPEKRWVGESMIATVTLATSEYRKNDRGEREEHTEWHSVTFFGRLVEIVVNYLHKGAHVYIVGKLRTRSWEDDEKKKRWRTDIVGTELIMLDGKREGRAAEANEETGEEDAPF